MSRLIDADEALNLIDGETKVETNSNVKAFNDALEVAIQIIDTQKTVKAIPIEWIMKWCNKHNRKSLEERLLKRYGVITMLEDWEKENE